MAGRGRRASTNTSAGSAPGAQAPAKVTDPLTATLDKDIKLAEKELECTDIQIQRANFIK